MTIIEMFNTVLYTWFYIVIVIGMFIICRSVAEIEERLPPRLLQRLVIVIVGLENVKNAWLNGTWTHSWPHLLRRTANFIPADDKQVAEMFLDLLHSSFIGLNYSDALEVAGFGIGWDVPEVVELWFKITEDDISDGSLVLASWVIIVLLLSWLISRYISASMAAMAWWTWANWGGSILLCLSSSAFILF